MYNESEDKTRLVRQMSQEAINLAMQSRWEEAVAANLTIIENMPNDVDAYNRLGKAYMELAEYEKSKEAYNKVLELDSDNTIAAKNINRLSQLKATKAGPKHSRTIVAPHQFVGEAGKSGVVTLQNLAQASLLARMAAGDRISLKVKGQQLLAENELGEYVGMVEPQHGPRIARFMEGGTRYSAAVVSIDENKVKIIIKETYQSPNQIGKVSFPPKPVEGFQTHVKDTLLRRRGAEEDEILEELEEGEYFGEEAGELIPEGFSILEEGLPMEEIDDGEEDLIEEEQ
jgi:tetratricopeptide (TPR) repeat protein